MISVNLPMMVVWTGWDQKSSSSIRQSSQRTSLGTDTRRSGPTLKTSVWSPESQTNRRPLPAGNFDEPFFSTVTANSAGMDGPAAHRISRKREQVCNLTGWKRIHNPQRLCMSSSHRRQRFGKPNHPCRKRRQRCSIRYQNRMLLCSPNTQGCRWVGAL